MSGLFHVSARDHGALVFMSMLARANRDEFLSLQYVADEMHLSQGYLEEVAASLKKAKLIEGKQGPAGGYRLTRPAREISMEDILTAIEGPLELVDCQSKGALCPVQGKCSSKRMLDALQRTIRTSLQQTTLAALME